MEEAQGSTDITKMGGLRLLNIWYPNILPQFQLSSYLYVVLVGKNFVDLGNLLLAISFENLHLVLRVGVS